MAKKPIALAMTMCQAINFKYGCHVVVNTRRFYRASDNRMVNLYILNDSFVTKDGQYITQKLYMTSSSVYICYFLQELMCAFDGREFTAPKDGYIRSRDSKDAGSSITYMLDFYKKEDK